MIIKNLLKELSSQKKELDKYRPLPPDIMGRVEQKMRLEWNYHSNAIEGNTLTLGETRSLILNGITAKGKPMKDHLDVEGHNEAILAIENAVKTKTPFNEVFIRGLHKVLLKKPYSSPAITSDGKPTRKRIEIGQYKTSPNNVETSTGDIFYFATPEETPAKMHDLMNWLDKEEKKEEHPLLIATGFHYQFVRIHPFDDGNGRMARILMNLILMKHGYPPAVIRMSLRDNYINTLETADKTESISDLTQFIGESLKISLNIMLKAAKGENFEGEDDLDKEIALFKASLNKSEELKELNNEVVGEVYRANIKPAIFYLVGKLQKISDAFAETKFNIEFRLDNQTGRMEELTERAAKRAFAQVLSKQVKNNFRFTFSFSLIGFKHEKSPQDRSVGMDAQLSRFNYTFKIGNKAYTGKYSDMADFDTDLKPLIKEMMKNLIKQLDAVVKKGKKE